MLAHFVFVPPGGGEADYSLYFEIPGVPQPGDYIQIVVDGETGTSDFIVRRTWWTLKHPNVDWPTFTDITKGDVPPAYVGLTHRVTVECEFAKGPFPTEDHKKSCEMYAHRKGAVPEFEESAY